MKTVDSMAEFLERKNGGICKACHVPHKPETLCSREQMAHRISKLVEANAIIPELLRMNKEITETAESFRQLLFKVDQAHDILMKLLTEYGTVGEEIKTEYMEKLDVWAKGNPHLNQDTLDQQLDLFHREHLTSGGSETNGSIKLPTGSTLDADSLRSTQIATLAEREPPSLIT